MTPDAIVNGFLYTSTFRLKNAMLSFVSKTREFIHLNEFNIGTRIWNGKSK